MNEWKHIETAPKHEDRVILVWMTDSHPRPTLWQCGPGNRFPPSVTHWMPLPDDPPEASS